MQHQGSTKATPALHFYIGMTCSSLALAPLFASKFQVARQIAARNTKRRAEPDMECDENVELKLCH